MELTNAQRLGLTMLAEIHSKLGITDGVNSDVVAKALWTRNEWAIEWEHGFLFEGGDESPSHVRHVADVLDMYGFLELSYGDLDDAGKAVVKEAYQYGEPRFPGFDGNEETEYMSAARFMIEELGRFSNFRGRDLNSHHPTVGTSRKMLRVFMPLRAKSSRMAGVSRLSADDIASIMRARLSENA